MLESWEHLEHDVRTHCVGLSPAVCHAAAVQRIRIYKHHKAPVHSQVAGVLSVAVAHVKQVGGNLTHRGISRALLLIVEAPSERRSSSAIKQLRNAPIGMSALTPPG